MQKDDAAKVVSNIFGAAEDAAPDIDEVPDELLAASPLPFLPCDDFRNYLPVTPFSGYEFPN